MEGRQHCFFLCKAGCLLTQLSRARSQLCNSTCCKLDLVLSLRQSPFVFDMQAERLHLQKDAACLLSFLATLAFRCGCARVDTACNMNLQYEVQNHVELQPNTSVIIG